MQTIKQNPRSIILDLLMEINEHGAYTHLILEAALRKYRYMEQKDRSFICRTVLGTVERRITLSYVLDRISRVPVAQMKPLIRNLLQMSAYQILFMDGVRDFAVCDEAVKLAGKRGFVNLKGFVNGVLRRLVREKDRPDFWDLTDGSVKALSVQYSTPEWLVEKWLAQFGSAQTEEILAAQFADRPLTVRVNRTRTTPECLAEQLKAQGLTVKQSEILPEALELSGYDDLEAIPQWQDGLFFVQDISSMTVAHFADIKPGMHVIDVCAAPGGKSTHIAEILNGTGIVEARDLTRQKAALIEENIARLCLTGIRTAVWDARTVSSKSVGTADLVIADLPCSGLGVIGKKPDIKYHADIQKCAVLAALQREILNACVPYVKKNGMLLYSTCTLNREENQDNAAWLVKEHGFVLEREKLFIPSKEENHDGFYIAGLRKQ